LSATSLPQGVTGKILVMKEVATSFLAMNKLESLMPAVVDREMFDLPLESPTRKLLSVPTSRTFYARVASTGSSLGYLPGVEGQEISTDLALALGNL